MPKAEAALFADSHLQRSAWSGSSIRDDSKFALQQIIDWCVRYKPTYLIGAGDLIDRQTNRSEPIHFFQQQLDRLQEARVKFAFIQGQHDADDPPWLAGHRWAIHLHKDSIMIGDMDVYGLDYQPAGKLREALEEIPEGCCDLLIAHQGWGEWMGEATLPQADFADLPGHVKRVFSGDLHQYMLRKHKGKEGQTVVCCSPGSTCMQAIDESPDKFFVTMDEEGAFKQQKLRSRVMLDWPGLLRKDDLERFMSEIEAALATATQQGAAQDLPEELLTPLIRVTYSHKLEDCVRRVEKVVGRRAYLFFKELPPEEKTVKPDQKAQPVKGVAVTPLTALPKEVDQGKEPEVFDLVSRLLTAGDQKMELAKWRAEYLAEEK
ncbi:MAG: metallophosphoesterase [Acidobacteria bacterium]|nr:metallophosphoesterase [Acidobacteriota bacterium]